MGVQYIVPIAIKEKLLEAKLPYNFSEPQKLNSEIVWSISNSFYKILLVTNIYLLVHHILTAFTISHYKIIQNLQ